jgi:hypothetical protein
MEVWSCFLFYLSLLNNFYNAVGYRFGVSGIRFHPLNGINLQPERPHSFSKESIGGKAASLTITASEISGM